ncbi:hypothetical protein B0H10DRAFT_1803124 [Mycena sp. CBHHK59/15]|nr:hypothetical protein B0H10DRAFT_1803124 [Mycena sp. CBHHK59/15]
MVFSPFLSFFRRHKSDPQPADFDTIPCTGLDLDARDLVITNSFIIDTRLDVEKLDQTLCDLVQKKFPRAGARLALRNGIYEFQIPRSFDPNTPPIAFTTDNYPEPYRSASRPEIPGSSSSKPSILTAPAFEVYLKSKTCPTSFEDFLLPNVPLVHLHVTTFDDLTFIGVTSTHITFDAMGTQALLYAWTRLINGEDIRSISGMNWNVAPFEAFRENQTAPTTLTSKRGWFALGFFARLSFIVRFTLRILRDPEEVRCIVHVPKKFLDDSKRDIMETQKLQGSTEWVSSSDVLLAWWFKTVFSHRRVNDTTPIHIHIPTDLRKTPIFHGGSTLSTPYINNAVSTIPVPPVPVNTFRKETLGEIALRIRRAIIAYNADLDGIRDSVRFRCTHPLKLVFPSAPHGEYGVQTNWRAAKFGELDFSGARSPGSAERARVVFMLGYPSSGKFVPMRGSGAILWEDEDSVWMGQVRGKKDWDAIRRSGNVAFI